jgi:hypothetical protein
MAYPSVFPTSLDSYTAKTDGLDDVMAVDVNELQSAIVAIETKLGTGTQALALAQGQIQFPATQRQSAGANVLDDYEEGTVTVTLTCGTSGTITLNVNTLSYTKIGRQVTLTGLLNVASVSSPVGGLTLNGLPFSVPNGNSFYGTVFVLGVNLLATAITSLTGYVNINTTTAILCKWGTGTVGNLAADIQAGSQLIISIIYFTA